LSIDLSLRTEPLTWPRKAVCVLLCAALVLPLPGVAQTAPAPAEPGRDEARGLQLPTLGDEASEDFSVGTERRLGDRVMREIRRDPAYLDDPLLQDYLQSLWQPLLAAARRKGEITPELDPRFAWDLFLVRDRSVNAFALPGGYIGVHLGLVSITQSRDELASVLAHELAHVTQRHIARGFSNSRRQSLIALAGMILGVLAASRANSADGMNAAIIGSQAAGVQGELNFSRELEREADRIGYSILTQGGYAPAGMAAMFERLEAASRLNDSGGFPYLRSHPLTTERIGDARARGGLGSRSLATQQAPVSAATAAAPTMGADHALAVARARVIADPREETLRRWQRGDGAPGQGPQAGAPQTASAPAEALMAASSAALASVLLREPARAEAAAQRARAALAAWPNAGPSAARAMAVLQAQVAVARGDAAAALQLLAPHDDRGSRLMLMAIGEAALASIGRPMDPSSATSGTTSGTTATTAPTTATTTPTNAQRFARERAEGLQTWLAAHPSDALAWQLSSQLWGRLGQPLRAIRAEAEARYALGDLTGASDRLRAGQTAARRSSGLDNDAIETTVIASRLREIDAQRRQIFLEERGGRGPPP
jgi:beta-barrel assembly-enhancing protease